MGRGEEGVDNVPHRHVRGLAICAVAWEGLLFLAARVWRKKGRHP